MPDIWLLHKDPVAIKKRFVSNYPPLGIVPSTIEDIQFEVLDLSTGDTLIMCSDGLLEARNSNNEYFGEERYFEAVKEGIQKNNIADLLMETLDNFVEGHCIEDHMFSKTDLVPLVMNQFQYLLPDSNNLQQIYTVFTELYLNALEHGVLGLPSSMKSDAEGFAKYFSEKEKRLKAVNTGWIDVKFQYESGDGYAELLIEIGDSGLGFDVDKWKRNFHQNEQLSGRGLNLVMGLTSALVCQPPDNHVKAIIRWTKENSSEAAH